MSTDLEQVMTGDRWSLTMTKSLGWLLGLAFVVFGGLLCAIPVGAVLGVPAVVIGLFLCLSFCVSMSASLVSPRVAVLLVVLGLVLVAMGRTMAPIDQLVESFRVNQTLDKRTGLGGAFGIPMLLVGVCLFQLAAPWVRVPDRMHFVRGVLCLILIVAASLALLVAAVMTRHRPDWHAQPLWGWIAVPLLIGLSVGSRQRWRGVSWVLVTLCTAVTLPLTWQALLRLQP